MEKLIRYALYLFVAISFYASISKATGYPEELENQIQTYYECLMSESAKTCTDKYYDPILEYCGAESEKCLGHFRHGDPGPVSFRRCSSPDSCTCEGESPYNQYFKSLIYPGEIRAEIRDPYIAPYEQEMLYVLSIKIPESTELTTDNQSIVITQLKALNGHSPTFAFRYKGNGDLAITIRHETEIEDTTQNGHEVTAFRGPLPKGKWLDFQVGVKTGPKGYLWAKLNQKSLVYYKGPVGYKNKGNYFKLGAYDYTGTQKTPFAVYYREFWRRAL